MTPKKEEKKEVTLTQYEDSIKKVEGIVSKLREGKLSLDESMKQYEEGVKTIKACMKVIEDMEKRVLLVTEKEGRVDEKPFE